MYVIANAGREKAALPGIEHLTLAGREEGLRRLSVWRQTMQAGCATPRHRHDCEEVILATEGSGEIEIEGRTYPFGPDSTLVVPPNTPHQIFNRGTTPLTTIAIFSTSPVDVYTANGDRLDLPWRT